MLSGVDQQSILARITADSGWSPRYAFMTAMSAGIAMLGLLVSSPAVIIGAMLVSPLMSPILGFGFSLATFNFAEARRSFGALALGSCLAVAFTAAIAFGSPLKDVTPEILARTRPNLFDLMVALFAALAGVYALIKGRGDTIVGVAIATALMPPLAVVGFGIATWNVPVLQGALALYVTNFVTIGLSATVMARLYGFGASLTSHQTLLQSMLLVLVFIGLASPLGLSLSQIAQESITVSDVRSLLSQEFGPTSRVSQLNVDFDAKPLVVRSVVIAPRSKSKSPAALTATLEKALGRPVDVQVDQILLGPDTSALDAQRAQLDAVRRAEDERASADHVAQTVGAIAGVPAQNVLVDAQQKTAVADVAALAGADLSSYRALEARAQAAAPDWHIVLTPPLQPLPAIRFAYGSDTLDDDAKQTLALCVWAAKRWNIAALAVPGLPTANSAPPRRPNLAQRRALAVAAILARDGVRITSAPPEGRTLQLSPSRSPQAS
ncbi:MAG: DUF389 domain-containing protein [Caulobacteraceae bacterium]